jgi:hypothetical protein
MKARTFLSLDLIASAVLFAPAFAQTPHIDQPHAVATHTFSSELGFELSYPSEWSVNISGPPLSVSQMSLDKQSESDPFRRSIECSQNIFSASFGEPRSNFLIGVITTECMGAKPDLDTFTRRTVTKLERGYQLSGLHYGAFSLQGQTFWVLRTSGMERRHPEENVTIEYLATVLPKGLVYLSAYSVNNRAQSGFEHAHLRLTSGVETELMPAGALDAKQAPAEEITRLGSVSTSSDLVPADTTISHHFDIGAGFTYEVPPEFIILNVEKWEAAQRQVLGSPQPPMHPCGVHRLIALPEDGFREVILTTYAQNCLMFANKPENLPHFMSIEAINLTKRYTLRNNEYGSFSTGSHSFWVMRCKANLKIAAWESDRYLAIVLTPIPDGMAEFFLMGRTRAALDAMMATVLKFDDGAATALVSTSAFDHNVELPAALEQIAQPGSNSSHHFDSGLGFSYDVPQELSIYNASNFQALLQAAASQRALTSSEEQALHCSQILLAAGSNNETKMILFIAYSQDCVGYAFTAANLPLIGRYGENVIAKRLTLQNPEDGSFTRGSHLFWALRSSMVPLDPSNHNRYIALLLVPTSQGVVQISLEARTQAALDELMATRLIFDDGVETEIIPDSVFAPRQASPPLP